jgi:hypothetical protein
LFFCFFEHSHANEQSVTAVHLSPLILPCSPSHRAKPRGSRCSAMTCERAGDAPSQPCRARGRCSAMARGVRELLRRDLVSACVSCSVASHRRELPRHGQAPSPARAAPGAQASHV